jgi:myo-inositol-1(or 4)-monophosphatase
VGGVGLGCLANGEPCEVSDGPSLDGCRILASRSECRRGEWTQFENLGFTIQPIGSVAHKLAVIAAGRADATWTLLPKNEWDVAGGIALLKAAGGTALLPGGDEPRFNQPDPVVDALMSGGIQRVGAIQDLIGV